MLAVTRLPSVPGGQSLRIGNLSVGHTVAADATVARQIPAGLVRRLRHVATIGKIASARGLETYVAYFIQAQPA